MFDVVGFAGVATGLDKAPRFFAAVLVLIVFNRTRHHNSIAEVVDFLLKK